MMANILLTEDDASVRTFVGRALELDGHSITAAENGEEALSKLEEKQGGFDLLLTDIRMPIMDGIALTHRVADKWPQMSVLLMTGYADQQEGCPILKEKVHGVLNKPFSLMDIRDAVNDALKMQIAA